MITKQLLIQLGVGPTQADQFADVLQAACLEFGLDTPQRQAAYLSQVLIESDLLVSLEENLHYSTPERIRVVFPHEVPTMEDAQALVGNPQALANRVYANRNGNGAESTGDGWTYRGRGLLQVTGRRNYAGLAQRLGLDLLTYPQILTEPEQAARSAAADLVDNGCCGLADTNQVDAITRVVNGPGMQRWQARRDVFNQALELLTC